MSDDFEQWLRSEIEHASTITVVNDNQPPDLASITYVHGRLRALKEVQQAYERSKTNG